MLRLSAKIGESIYIGDDIKIIVVGYDRGSVRLAFEASDEIEIDRESVRRLKRGEDKHTDSAPVG